MGQLKSRGNAKKHLTQQPHVKNQPPENLTCAQSLVPIEVMTSDLAISSGA
jgi:hypothetical protein